MVRSCLLFFFPRYIRNTNERWNGVHVIVFHMLSSAHSFFHSARHCRPYFNSTSMARFLHPQNPPNRHTENLMSTQYFHLMHSKWKQHTSFQHLLSLSLSFCLSRILVNINNAEESKVFKHKTEYCSPFVCVYLSFTFASFYKHVGGVGYTAAAAVAVNVC